MGKRHLVNKVMPDKKNIQGSTRHGRNNLNQKPSIMPEGNDPVDVSKGEKTRAERAAEQESPAKSKKTDSLYGGRNEKSPKDQTSKNLRS